MDAQKINLHTHTTFCDGKNTAEEMVLAAIEKGFTILGFSGHSLYPFARSWHIAPREFTAYASTVRDLAEKYADRIRILLGFEADYFPGISVPTKENYSIFRPDFLIGSVHYVVSEKGHYSVDNTKEKVELNILRLYNGDGKKAVCEYFAAQRKLLEKGDFGIWAHPDLIRIRNGALRFFDENESWYIDELAATAKAAAKSGVVAEINTGAIARGTMDDFYPSAQFLELLHEKGVPVLVGTDAHSADQIDCAYDRACAFAKKAGYRELVYPVSGENIIVPL